MAPVPSAPAAPKKSATRFIAPVLAFLLLIALIATAGFSYSTVNGLQHDLDATKTALTNEQNAHATADHNTALVTSCVTALKKDLGDLQQVQTDDQTLGARLVGQGDWNAARVKYEDDLSTYASYAVAAANDLLANNSTKFQSDAATANTAYQRALADKASLDTLQASVDSVTSQMSTKLSNLQSQMEATRQGVCKAFS